MGSNRARRPKEKGGFSISIRFNAENESRALWIRGILTKLFPGAKRRSYPVEDGNEYGYIVLEIG